MLCYALVAKRVAEDNVVKIVAVDLGAARRADSVAFASAGDVARKAWTTVATECFSAFLTHKIPFVFKIFKNGFFRSEFPKIEQPFYMKTIIHYKMPFVNTKTRKIFRR